MFGLTDPNTDLVSPPPTFTRKEVAQLFGISDVTVKRLTNEKDGLNPDRINPRVLRYKGTDLQRMVALGYHFNAIEAARLGVDTTALVPPPPLRKAKVLEKPVPPSDQSALKSLLGDLLLAALRDTRVRAELRFLIREACDPSGD